MRVNHNPWPLGPLGTCPCAALLGLFTQGPRPGMHDVPGQERDGCGRQAGRPRNPPAPAAAQHELTLGPPRPQPLPS